MSAVALMATLKLRERASKLLAARRFTWWLPAVLRLRLVDGAVMQRLFADRVG